MRRHARSRPFSLKRSSQMTTTPACATSRVSSTLRIRIRSLAGWADQIDTARLLHVTAVTVATAVAGRGGESGARTFYPCAARHGGGRGGPIVPPAGVPALHPVTPACAGGARLHGGKVPRLSWLVWWIAVGVGLAA